MSRTPEKRPAFEPAALLVEPGQPDPGMTRPMATVTGAVLVLLRAVVGVQWMIALGFGWQSLTISLTIDDGAGGPPLTVDEAQAALIVVLCGVGILVLVDVALAFLIFRGWNWPRVFVMFVSVVSICSAFFSWWFQGQELRLDSTLLSLALDILVLLALSSRGAAAYARRNRRRPEPSQD
ncbi:hypothetical protein ABCS02_13735 [Microbacterium sp. X-17]|uniref:hypothetical protein n=1 Tax=Microbacterium sp. X-17 TaxID=3144404 RepID=UPI0031F4D34F